MVEQMTVDKKAVEQIQRAHRKATPKPEVNPAWANAERDIGVLLAYIDQQVPVSDEAALVALMAAYERRGERLMVAASRIEQLEMARHGWSSK